MIFGLCISGIGTYAATQVISSSKVSYLDNSSLGVDNVQAAIDGTCENVNNRLTDIESSLLKSKSYYVPLNSSKTISLSDVTEGNQALIFIRIGVTLTAYMVDGTAITNNFSSASTPYITATSLNGNITITNTNTTSAAVVIVIGI